MTEMLNQLKPGETTASDTELLQQLFSVCKQMQQRVVELIPNLSEEEMIGELLVMNDDMNNIFIRYERFDRLNTMQRGETDQLEAQTDTGNLIDLNPVSPSSNHNTLSAANQANTADNPSANINSSVHADKEFDMFAQTRSSSLAEQRKSVRYEDPGAVEGLAEALDTRLQVTAGIPAPHSSVMDDIENWLTTESPDIDDAEGVTSEDFDKFLADRAKAADHLPSTKQTSSACVSHTSPRQQTSKQDQKDDELFSL